MRWQVRTAWRNQRQRRAFSLAELLVVIGIISLLLAITVPTLQLARRQAQQTVCAANEQQLGVGLENLRTNYDGFYPLWDDAGGPIRYTWIDVLVQLQVMGNHQTGYCPSDLRPDRINQARAELHGLAYPGNLAAAGVDYSYGISAVLSAGGWQWQPRFSPPGDQRPRRFWNHEQDPARRLLAADAAWNRVYNLSGRYLETGIWNQPTQFDNTVAFQRHPGSCANVLMKDGHVESVRYRPRTEQPVDTLKCFVWYRGEPDQVGPEYEYADPDHQGNFYPNVPPIDWDDESLGGVIPCDLIPNWYTQHGGWTNIGHKW